MPNTCQADCSQCQTSMSSQVRGSACSSRQVVYKTASHPDGAVILRLSGADRGEWLAARTGMSP
jgi:hypothetical protein